MSSPEDNGWCWKHKLSHWWLPDIRNHCLNDNSTILGLRNNSWAPTTAHRNGLQHHNLSWRVQWDAWLLILKMKRALAQRWALSKNSSQLNQYDQCWICRNISWPRSPFQIPSPGFMESQTGEDLIDLDEIGAKPTSDLFFGFCWNSKYCETSPKDDLVSLRVILVT